MSLITQEPPSSEGSNRKKLVDYIKEYDPFFRDADFERYSYYELVVIKVSIEVEKEKMKRDTTARKI
ncbi:MAG TPA: hypothetical protein VI112_14660 [Bacteroidia bacterium]|jgi:hypothetical protein